MEQDEPERVLRYAPVTRSRHRLSWAIVVVLAIVLGLMLSMLVADAVAARQRSKYAPFARCASNLRQIGQASLMYAYDGGGGFADSFGELLATQQLGADVFVCRMATEQKAMGGDLEETAADLGRPGRCSYVYVQSGLTTKSPPGAVVAFEDPANHGMTKVNVLYADGSVEMVSMAKFMPHLNDLAQGVNPPTSPPMASNAAAVAAYEKAWRSRMPMLKARGLRLGAPEDSP